MNSTRSLSLPIRRAPLTHMLRVYSTAARQAVDSYHQTSKHTTSAFAPGPGQLDWATQPDPFLTYEDASTQSLPPVEGGISRPLYADLYRPGSIESAAPGSGVVSRLLYHSLALSAWKQAGTSKWALRVNPSSGNLHPTEASPPTSATLHQWIPPASLLQRLKDPSVWCGTPQPLSPYHRDWPDIMQVHEATTRRESQSYINTDDEQGGKAESGNFDKIGQIVAGLGGISENSIDARKIIRQRRSAVDMQEGVGVTAGGFMRMLGATLPSAQSPAMRVLPWKPQFDLALFVHRVSGLDPGLYILLRDPTRRPSTQLARTFKPSFTWTVPDKTRDLPLFRLVGPADATDTAQIISCGQEIAGHGCFAVSMLADYESGLATYGPSFYKRLYWEAGAIGQILYLETEACGLSGTGIGCYFDDLMHTVLGTPNAGPTQALYHFTVGARVDDERLQSLSPYHHLEGGKGVE